MTCREHSKSLAVSTDMWEQIIKCSTIDLTEYRRPMQLAHVKSSVSTFYEIVAKKLYHPNRSQGLTKWEKGIVISKAGSRLNRDFL
jgi:hypothetical protein